uniref:Uncharacterized protein n=1 Tax=Romanomermis culicivorax TaxID=13658 RepID=A0A915IUY9_ROMCU
MLKKYYLADRICWLRYLLAEHIVWPNSDINSLLAESTAFRPTDRFGQTVHSANRFTTNFSTPFGQPVRSAYWEVYKNSYIVIRPNGTFGHLELLFNEKSWSFLDNSSAHNNIYDHDRHQNILLDANHNRIIRISSNLKPHLHIVSQLPYSYDRRRIQIQGSTSGELPSYKSDKIVLSPAPSSTNNNNYSPAASFVGSKAANFFPPQKSPISGKNFGVSISYSPASFSKLDRKIQTSPSTKLSVQGARGAAQGSFLHGNNPSHQGYVRTEVEDLTHQGAVKQQPLSQKKISSKSELSHWVATRPGCRLARAKYNYKPLRDSPNDNPELELCLQPGDYVILFGEMDEDYFYHGELYNGQQGLVPSNYIEIVPEDELAISVSRIKSSMRALPKPQDNPPSKMQNKGNKDNIGGMDPTKFRRTATTSILSDLQASSNIVQLSRRDFKNRSLSALTLPDSSCPYPSVDVSGVSVFEVRQPDNVRVPCPRDLLVERQLAKSILISWSPPQNPLIPVTHYHVCVDGTVKSVIPGSSKTKALIEDVDCLKEHRISVRAVTDQGHSCDPSCTVTSFPNVLKRAPWQSALKTDKN